MVARQLAASLPPNLVPPTVTPLATNVNHARSLDLNLLIHVVQPDLSNWNSSRLKRVPAARVKTSSNFLLKSVGIHEEIAQ